LLSLKSLDADLVEALALTPRPHGKGLVKSWPCAQQEFTAVFQWDGRLFSFCKAVCHHFLDDGAELRIDLGLIVTVCAAAEKLWAPPYVAVVFFTPFDDFDVSTREFFEVHFHFCDRVFSISSETSFS